MKITGGCLCRQIRFVADGEVVFALNCHCRMCQQVTGSGYTPVAAFKAVDVKIDGEIKYFERTGDSGRKVWEGFCPECGARLTGKAETIPGLLLLQAGAFDDPNQFKPSMDIFTGSAAHWDAMDPALPKFPGMPVGL
ncbi:MAG: aldehyde-activating protein [Gammaproteobacteria bacterium]|nr:aldehyde-activating protein [Gammaproteobacteria bacterium]